jgi:hypothetical protein
VRIGDGHPSSAVPEDRHDCLDTRPTLGELGAHGVPKPMRRDRRLPVRINEASSRASRFERVFEQISAADRLPSVDEHPVNVSTGPSIVVRRGEADLRCSISSRNASAA